MFTAKSAMKGDDRQLDLLVYPSQGCGLFSVRHYPIRAKTTQLPDGTTLLQRDDNGECSKQVDLPTLWNLASVLVNLSFPAGHDVYGLDTLELETHATGVIGLRLDGVEFHMSYESSVELAAFIAEARARMIARGFDDSYTTENR